ncbi:rRNA maturation RNase YbeY, partial [Acinetobacter baumannii]
MNSEFRGIDQPTDVLTFPADQSVVGAPLGDIAIGVGYATRQARARGVSLTQELCYLAIHGALHLAGFDDETEQDRL